MGVPALLALACLVGCSDSSGTRAASPPEDLVEAACVLVEGETELSVGVETSLAGLAYKDDSRTLQAIVLKTIAAPRVDGRPTARVWREFCDDR
jgi:hypothetical protein